MSLFAELKRRNVFKVGAAYLALAWVIVQITGAVVPALNLPASLVPTVVWIGVIGFPCVLIFSWVYELTPEGLKRESEVDRSQSITHVTSKRLDYIIIAMLAAAMLIFALDRFVPRAPPNEPVGTGPARDSRDDRAQGALPQEVNAADRAQGALPQQGPHAAAVPDDKSIAVLPFVNMSEDASNEYFADGISEELLNLLVKIPELQVSSRSSAFSFKGKDLDIPAVAAKLNVAHILEGSVRKSGTRVRITAQLIDARSDKHLWSETYDRELTDIFAVQDEIASAVTAQMRITLLGAPPQTRVVKPEAYALFLQARQLRRQNTAASLAQAVELVQQALALDPSYAEAWDELSRIYVNQASGNLRPVDEAFRLAREAVNKALALDPDLARAHDSLGWIAGTYDLDFAAAARHYARALQLEPANLSILGNAAGLLWGLGRLDEAITVMEYTTSRDPINTIGLSNLAGAYLQAGRLDESLARTRMLLNLAPDYIGARAGLALALFMKGEHAAALTEAQQETDAIQRLQAVALSAHALGQRESAEAALAELQDRYAGLAPYLIATVRVQRGDADGAFQRLDEAVAARDSYLSSAHTDPLLARLHDDPRWLPFLRRINLTPEQLDAIAFEVKIPL